MVESHINLGVLISSLKSRSDWLRSRSGASDGYSAMMFAAEAVALDQVLSAVLDATSAARSELASEDTQRPSGATPSPPGAK
jgi:hypothetical protein